MSVAAKKNPGPKNGLTPGRKWAAPRFGQLSESALWEAAHEWVTENQSTFLMTAGLYRPYMAMDDEDILQEALLCMFDVLCRCNRDGKLHNFSRYVLGAWKRICIRAAAGVSTAFGIDPVDLPAPEEMASPIHALQVCRGEEHPTWSPDARPVVAALKKLAPAQRMVCSALIGDGPHGVPQSIREIATKHGCARQVIQTHYHRSLQKLTSKAA